MTRGSAWLLLFALAPACGGGDASPDPAVDAPADADDASLDAPKTDLPEPDAPAAEAAAPPDVAPLDAEDAPPEPDAVVPIDVPPEPDVAPACPDATLPDGACLRCAAGERVCGRVCARADDPAYGCGDEECAPCAFDNAAATCARGECAMGACREGFADCDRDPGNGCETSTATDAANCGACNRRCEPDGASGACVAGRCTVGRCDEGYGNCDGDDANGCEVNTRTTAAHCGACGMRCSLPDAVSDCAEGRCGVADCVPGFANCNGSAADGCEVDTRSSLAHCGTCGSVCRVPRAQARCAAGVCSLDRCEAGYGDCDGDLNNGCESELQRDPAHCGACSAAPCPQVCAAGACAPCSMATAGQPCGGGGICRCTGSACACPDA